MSVEPPLKPTDHSKVEFLRYHKPPLLAGNYQITAIQNLASTAGKDKEIHGEFGRYNVTRVASLPTAGNAQVFIKLKAGDNAICVFDPKGHRVVNLDEADLAKAPALLSHLARTLKDVPINTEHLEQIDTELAAHLSPVLGQIFETQKTFTVAGERYVLNPQEILSVFPPADSKGEHANVLPHVILRRSTLPWERSPDANLDGNLPEHPPCWMGILLFDDSSEAPAPKPHIVPLGRIGEGSEPSLYCDASVSFLPDDRIFPEGGETKDAPIRVIDVPLKDALALVPSETETELIAHVRQRVTAENNEIGGEHAIVVGNRLPQKGGASIAYLVSLENRYVDGKFWHEDDIKDVRFVVLKTWRFSCLSTSTFLLTKSQFPLLLSKLSEKGAALMTAAQSHIVGQEKIGEDKFTQLLPNLDGDTDLPKVVKTGTFRKLSFKSLLMDLDRDVLRRDPVDGPAAPYVARGNVLVPHQLRNGNVTASWYHSPLSDGGHDRFDVNPVACTADHLLRYNEQLGLLDTSYATAWQLGRLMMLQAKSVSLALFNWKRAHALQRKGAQQQLSHLPFSRLPAPLDMPQQLRKWFYETALLNGVPFSHLVPDPNMLPDESIRFFELDTTWIECMLDGAFSIGRINTNDVQRDQDLVDAYGAPLASGIGSKGKPFPTAGASGVLIKSDVVSGWPHLQVDGLVFLGENDAGTDLSLADIRTSLSRGGAMDEKVWRVLDKLGLALPPSHDCKVDVTEWHEADQKDAPQTAVAWIVRGPDGEIEFEVENDRDHHGPEDAGHTYGDRLALKLPTLRFDRLAPGILLVIFHGLVETVDVHMKPEAIHFGLSEPHVGRPNFYKELRDKNGREDPSKKVDPVLFRLPKDGPWLPRVVDVNALVYGPGGIAETLDGDDGITSAQFALQMVEGVDRVRFDMARKPD